MAGKGDTRRPTNWAQWDKNYERIYGDRNCGNCNGDGKVDVGGMFKSPCPICLGNGKMKQQRSAK